MLNNMRYFKNRLFMQLGLNRFLFNKEPGTGSLLPICRFQTMVMDIQIRNRQLVPGSRFSVPDENLHFLLVTKKHL